MDLPNDRKYLESHEWHKIAGDTATIGITQTAADELTGCDVRVAAQGGRQTHRRRRFGEIESVKATSDMYSGLSGTVTEVNDAVVE